MNRRSNQGRPRSMPSESSQLNWLVAEATLQGLLPYALNPPARAPEQAQPTKMATPDSSVFFHESIAHDEWHQSTFARTPTAPACSFRRRRVASAAVYL